MKNLLWYLVAGTKGGETRGKIISLLKKTPSNANKIAETLMLDYKTVRHHLEVLEKKTPYLKQVFLQLYQYLLRPESRQYPLLSPVRAKAFPQTPYP